MMRSLTTRSAGKRVTSFVVLRIIEAERNGFINFCYSLFVISVEVGL